MEPEIDSWSQIEYLNLLQNVDLQLVVTEDLLATIPDAFKQVVSTIPANNWPKKEQDRVLLLDPSSPYQLVPEDKANFDYLLFGGILGDDP